MRTSIADCSALETWSGYRLRDIHRAEAVRSAAFTVTARHTMAPRAQGDLDEIWAHTVTQWGIEQAESSTRHLEQDIETLAAQPSIGGASPEIRAGDCKYPSGSHLQSYRRTGDGIDIVRSLHQRMDLGRHI